MGVLVDVSLEVAQGAGVGVYGGLGAAGQAEVTYEEFEGRLVKGVVG